MGKAKITAVKAGPFRVQHIKRLIKSKGKELTCTGDLYLCRCGESLNKPYCDGTHERNGFTGENTEKHVRNKTIAYKGKEITVYDNRNICSHSGYCTAELPAVFSYDIPWINPDGEEVEKIIAICTKCPSGALTYARTDGERDFGKAKETPAIRVVGSSRQGPYVITGRVKIEGQLSREPESPIKATLCRCGHSQNKPYCNGDHRFIMEQEEQTE